jgi:hypothetical protein
MRPTNRAARILSFATTGGVCCLALRFLRPTRLMCSVTLRVLYVTLNGVV